MDSTMKTTLGIRAGATVIRGADAAKGRRGPLGKVTRLYLTAKGEVKAEVRWERAQTGGTRLGGDGTHTSRILASALRTVTAARP